MMHKKCQDCWEAAGRTLSSEDIRSYCASRTGFLDSFFLSFFQLQQGLIVSCWFSEKDQLECRLLLLMVIVSVWLTFVNRDKPLQLVATAKVKGHNLMLGSTLKPVTWTVSTVFIGHCCFAAWNTSTVSWVVQWITAVVTEIACQHLECFFLCWVFRHLHTNS